MNLRVFLLLLAGLAWQTAAPAQTLYAPTTVDLLAPGSTATTASATSNTGTDVARLNAKDLLQVMVWDKTPGTGANQVFLSWSVNKGAGATGSVGITTLVNGAAAALSDPDVTMAFLNGALYAAVVYVAKDQSGALPGPTVQTYLDVYKWTGASFARYGAFNGGVPLGLGTALISAAGGLPSSLRVHSSPNIDANAAGKVGIVWQETTTETAEIRVIAPSYPAPGYTFFQLTTFAESYVLDCNIDGTGFYCTNPTRGVLATRSNGPLSNATNPSILFNQSLSPDVAVSPAGVISFCYLGAAADPASVPVSSGTRLVLKQYTRDCNIFNTSYGSYNWSLAGTTGVPRIAATPHAGSPNDTDVEIVMAWQGAGCLDGIGPRAYYEVLNWGRSAGTFRPAPTTVSLPTVYTDNGYPAVQPVVAFASGEGTSSYSDEYVVAWAGLNYPKNSSSYDVWSTTLVAGVVQNANSYSRVNYTLAGDQTLPSVAGRYSGTPKSMAYLFYDAKAPQLSYRYSTVPAGNGGLNRAAAPGASAPGSPSPARALEAFPNPSTAAVDFNLHLRPGETVQRLTVVDLLGRVLEEVRVPASQAPDQAVRWQPRQGLPTGSYLVKLVTDQRTENITVSRE